MKCLTILFCYSLLFVSGCSEDGQLSQPSVPGEKIRLLETTHRIGNDKYGVADSIFLRFSSPVTVKYIRAPSGDSWRPNINNISSTDADSNRVVAFSLPGAVLGGSYTFDFCVFNNTGDTLTHTDTVNFYQGRIDIPGRIFDTLLDENQGRYWIGTANPNAILCFSFPDLSFVKSFSIPNGGSKFFLNTYNNRFYVLCNDRSSNANDSAAYVYDSQSGVLLKKVLFGRDGYDHPQVPRIYPYDIAFASTGYGVALLRDENFSGLRWKVVDSRDNDSIFIHSAWGFGIDQYPYFHKIYPNFDGTKLFFLEEYGSCAIDVLDGNTHTFQHRVPSSITRGVFITPNRKNNRIYCGQLYDQFILEENGAISQISYIDNRNDGTAHFSYRPGEESIVYFIDGFLHVLDYAHAEVLMWCRVIGGVRSAITTLDGSRIIAFRLVDYPNSEVFVFGTDEFYAYNPARLGIPQRTRDDYLFDEKSPRNQSH